MSTTTSGRMSPRPVLKRWRPRSVIPGFGLSAGITVSLLTLLVLIPLVALVLRASELGIGGILSLASQPRIAAALWTSFSLSFVAAIANVILGVLTAWVLVRYRFPGRKLLDAVVDLPFALPTAVAGIALASLYAPNGWIGSLFAPLGIKIAYTPIGIFIALVFIGMPFMVRTVEPILADFQTEIEEAAATLGAGRIRTIARVLLPPLTPAVVTGFALAFARGVGEYGSVIFIAGNIPFVSEIAPLLIVVKLEEYDYPGATAIAVVMLAVSFIMLLAINAFGAWTRRRFGHA